MNVKDFRVGNMLLCNDNLIHDNDVCEIICITKNSICVKSSHYEFWHDFETQVKSVFKPIPLTEEILLKCGFEGSNKTDFSHSEVPAIEIEWGGVEYNVDVMGIIISRIKYLHQLQNLIFALTGKELTINL